MVKLNASFIIERAREDEFLDWFEEKEDKARKERKERRALKASEEGRDSEPVKEGDDWADDFARKCEVLALRDANGEDYIDSESHTLAAQWKFFTLEDAREWRQRVLMPVMEEFMERFQPGCLYFTSIFYVL